MTSRERLQIAADFREADRVPIELQMGAHARSMPEAARIVEFVDHEADNFLAVPLVDWGFFGLDAEYSERIIEDVPGDYRRIERTQHTAAGDFKAITRHSYENLEAADYRWERRYIHDLADMQRLAAGERAPRPIDPEVYRDHAARHVGDRGIAMTGILHPLGTLVRRATMEEVYGWFISEAALMHRFLENCTARIIATVDAVGAIGLAPWFVTGAHEMLIPPWMGMRQFKEWVFPYDKAVNDAVHAIGGKRRSHCHGNCMQFLEIMYAMGIDATEPLEPSPLGDVDLAEAKRQMHGKMMLSGNVPSQYFPTQTPAETRQQVRAAIDAAATGGGFALRTTGGHAGLADNLTPAQRVNVVANIEAYIDAGLEYGRY